jgi:DNA-binding transcriptional MerR regulator
MSETGSGRFDDIWRKGSADARCRMRHGMSTLHPPQYLLTADKPSDNHSGSPESEPSYTIGDLARKFDISLRTLRFYESRGLLSPGRDGRRRLYARKDADRLAVIRKAKKLGFTLSEIRQMIAEEASQQTLRLSREKCLEQIALFERKLAEIEDALAELRWIYTSLSARMVEAKPADEKE